MLISYSDEAVDISADALPISVIIGVVTDIGVDVLADANTNVLAVVITDSEFVISEPVKKFSC